MTTPQEENENPCREMLHRFIESEKAMIAKEDVESRMESFVLLTLTFLVITCLLMSMTAQFISTIVTMGEAGVLAVHQRHVFMKMFTRIRQKGN